jgi:hypothetical protein
MNHRHEWLALLQPGDEVWATVGQSYCRDEYLGKVSRRTAASIFVAIDEHPGCEYRFAASDGWHIPRLEGGQLLPVTDDRRAKAERRRLLAELIDLTKGEGWHNFPTTTLLAVRASLKGA